VTAPIPSEPDPARGSPALGAGGVCRRSGRGRRVGSAYWDDSWHTTLGRDSIFIPPHLLLYASILTVGADAGLGWRRLAATRSVAAVFRTPGFALAVAAAVATAAAAPADAFWHTAFGRDAVLWSPPHLLSVIGTLCVLIGPLTGTDRHVPAPPRIALAAGVLGAALIIVMEYDTDVPQFTETLYLPLLLATTLGAAWVITTLVPGRTRLVLVVAGYLVFRVVVGAAHQRSGGSPPTCRSRWPGSSCWPCPSPLWRWPVAALAVTTLQLLASGTGISSPTHPVAWSAVGATTVIIVSMIALTVRPGTRLRSGGAAAALTLLLVALAPPPPAQAHDPGQGTAYGTAQMTVTGDGTGQLTVTITGIRLYRRHRPHPVRLVARRAGEDPPRRCAHNPAPRLPVPSPGNWRCRHRGCGSCTPSSPPANAPSRCGCPSISSSPARRASSATSTSPSPPPPRHRGRSSSAPCSSPSRRHSRSPRPSPSPAADASSSLHHLTTARSPRPVAGGRAISAPATETVGHDELGTLASACCAAGGRGRDSTRQRR
jgi:hypothetical protein